VLVSDVRPAAPARDVARATSSSPSTTSRSARVDELTTRAGATPRPSPSASPSAARATRFSSLPGRRLGDGRPLLSSIFGTRPSTCAGARSEIAHCTIARTLSVIGDRWTLLVLRDAFLGTAPLEVFQASLASPATASPIASGSS